MIDNPQPHLLTRATGEVVAIAVKTERRGPMKTLDRAEAVVDGGLTDDLPVAKKRGVTFLSEEDWTQTLAELSVELPWWTRRANVLVRGIDLILLIGKRIRCGTVELHIRGETEPCPLMDEQCPGLQEALRPQGRGGIYGQVLVGGTFQPGDRIEVLSEE